MIHKFLKEFKLVHLTKKDTVFLSLCLILYIIFIALTYQKWGSPVVDCGRDIYVAERVLNGDHLYTDVYYVYGPLAPYILAGLFFIFGTNLNVAYWLGIILTLITLFFLYLIAKKILNSTYAFLTAIFSIIAICFSGTIFNFIFPYTYSALIGCFLTVVLAYFFCLQLKKENNIYLVSIGILTGLLCITKIEFAFASIVAIISYFIISKLQNNLITKKSILVTIVPAMLIILASIIIILTQSGMEEISKYIEYSKLSLNSESSKYFIGTILGHKSIISLYTNNLNSLFIVFMMLVILNLSVYKIASSKYKPYTYLFASIFSIILIILTLLLFTDQSGDIFGFRHLVIPLVPFILTALIISYFIKYFVKKQKLSYKDQIVLLLSIITIASSIRIFFYYYFSFYSTFYSLLAMIVIFYLARRCSSYLILKYKITKKIRYYLNSSFILIFILCCLNASLINYFFKNTPVSSSKGTIKTEEIMAADFNTLLTFLKTKDQESTEFMIAPESTLIYFLADKKSPTKFYDYLPMRLTTPEQENYIIESLKSKNINTIAVTNRNTDEYGFTYWGTDYNQTLYNWIKQNYQMCGLIGSDKPDSGFSRFPYFKILIYQKECK